MWCFRSAIRTIFSILILTSIASLMVLFFINQNHGKTVISSFQSSQQLYDIKCFNDYNGIKMNQSFDFDSNDVNSDNKPVSRDIKEELPMEPQHVPQRQATSSSDSSERRRSLLIYGADRSGTTFISRMFSNDPQIFMIYEPLWVTKQWRKRLEGNWSNSELEVLSGILGCRFADFPRATQFLAHTSRNWAAASFTNPFTTPNFCNVTESGQMSCPDLVSMPKFVDHVCSTKYKHSVTKVAQVRVPDKMLWNVVPQIFLDNPDTDIRVIHILRDPRGSMDSRIKLGWMPKHTAPVFVQTVRLPCKNIAQNVKYGRSLSEKFRHKYMEVHYRDIALHPVKTAQKIYSFAGFEMPEELFKWIIVNTSPSEEALKRDSERAFSSVRNSSANFDKWRYTSPPEQVEIIERECRELMQLLGLRKRNDSNLVPRPFLRRLRSSLI